MLRQHIYDLQQQLRHKDQVIASLQSIPQQEEESQPTNLSRLMQGLLSSHVDATTPSKSDDAYTVRSVRTLARSDLKSIYDHLYQEN